MADVLSFCVPTFPGNGSVYPSVNVLIGQLKGKKSPEYHDLRIAVREAARVEMLRIGWVTADYYVDLFWKRYVTSRRGFDPMNCLKCESDSLEPDPSSDFAGVYVNDKLVRPHVDLPQYDATPGAVDRIAIAVFRLYPNIIDATVAPKKRGTPSPAQIIAAPTVEQKRQWASGDPIPPGYALCNGGLIPIGEAMSLIGASGKNPIGKARR